MRIHWKLLVGFSLFGALISLISGIAGGNPVGTVILRMVLSGVVFGGLGMAVQMILRRYLPDLLQAPAPPARRDGGNVDIIIDEDLSSSATAGAEEDLEVEEADAPQRQRRPPEEELFQEGEPGDTGVEPGELDGGAPGDSGPGEEYVAEEEFAPDALLEPDAALEADAALGADSAFGSDAAFEPRETSRRETSPTGGSPSRTGAAAPADGGDLEVLPEFDALDSVGGLDGEPLPAGPPGESEAPARRTPATPREMRQAQIEETVRDQDPENLARAVRTFLKKDQ
jgi:hypothetical protein